MPAGSPANPAAPAREIPALELCTPQLRWIYRERLDPRYLDAPQAVTAEELACWLMLAGAVTLRDATRAPATFRAGDIILLSGLDLAATWTPAARLISVRIRLPGVAALQVFHARGLAHLTQSDSPALARATRALGAWAARHCPGARTNLRARAVAPGAWLRLQGLYFAWLEALHATLASRRRPVSGQARLDPRVLRALERVRDRPHMPERELAAAAGISLGQLQRLFRQQLGRSIHDVANEARLRHAQALLTTPDIFIKEVADRTGFSSAQSFARWFRQHAGCSPTDYQTRASHLV